MSESCGTSVVKISPTMSCAPSNDRKSLLGIFVQLVDTPTRGLTNRELVRSWTGQLTEIVASCLYT